MLYWKNATPGTEFHLAIPNNYGFTSDDLGNEDVTIEVRNDVGRWVVIGNFAQNWVTPGFVCVRAETSAGDPPSGEYTYRASTHDGRIISVGLMVFGDYRAPAPEEYEKTIEYEQYD